MRRIDDRVDTAVETGETRREKVLGLYLVAAVLVGAYAITLVAWPPSHGGPVIAYQLVGAFEVALALGCLARTLTMRPGRGVSLALGSGLLAWAVGDLIWNGSSSPSGPSVADAFFLVFYPLATVALVLLLRAEGGPKIKLTTWVDGAIAVLGVTAIACAFAVDSFPAITGSPASVMVHIAYPVGDVLLLGLAVAVVVMVPVHSARVMLLASGSALMAAANIAYFSQSVAGTYRAGTALDLLWPAAMLAMSASVWLHSRGFSGRRGESGQCGCSS